MFPANEFVIAAEDAYRRERMVAVRPPRRTRRAHRTRHPKPLRRHGLRQLLVSRTSEAGQTVGRVPDQRMGQGVDCACAA